ncbi:MAG: Nif3-like dinuclear metal center hexameric protein [Cytophagales bacterium]|nr:Nif3-like dinuclear metal center hexameric protein [Armatimonadota bacterium]
MATLAELMAFLEARLALPDDAPEKDVPLLWRPATGGGEANDLHRVGLALNISPAVEGMAKQSRSETLFLHRPFELRADTLPGLPLLASHQGFDAHLTLGYNPAIATALQLIEIEPLFRPDRPRDPVPVGMVGNKILPMTWSGWRGQVTQEFQGLDEAMMQGDERAPIVRVVIMNALNPVLIALAAERGATTYITGQMREGAREAARELGISVLAVGHERIERWGLRRLACEIEQAFPGLKAKTLFDRLRTEQQ